MLIFTMTQKIKPVVSKEDTFDLLEIRLGLIIAVEPLEGAARPSYVIKADFGKFGLLTSVGRFTRHSIEELNGKQVLGILNFEPRQIGGVVSEFLCLGVQFPKADSGDATIVTPLAEAKVGGKLF